MRLFYQIFIIFFVIISLYIIKEDVIVVYDRLVSYLEDGNFDKSQKNQISKSGVDESEVFQGYIDTPGALKVSDKLLFSNKDFANSNLISDKIIYLTNNARSEQEGLGELSANKKLNLSAEKKIEDMFSKQYFEHISPNGVGVGDLGNQFSYDYLLMGENLAMGTFKTEEDLIKAWMNSEGHRLNILNKNYTEIGVAIKKGKFEGRDVWMAVQHFGLPKDYCPKVDNLLKTSIGVINEKIKNINQDLVSRRDAIDKGAIHEGLTPMEQIIKYNEIVTEFNKLTIEIKQKIESYNNQVKDFNSCLMSIK